MKNAHFQPRAYIGNLQLFKNNRNQSSIPPHPHTSSTGSLLQSSSLPSTSTLFSCEDLVEHKNPPLPQMIHQPAHPSVQSSHLMDSNSGVESAKDQINISRYLKPLPFGYGQNESVSQITRNQLQSQALSLRESVDNLFKTDEEYKKEGEEDDQAIVIMD